MVSPPTLEFPAFAAIWRVYVSMAKYKLDVCVDMHTEYDFKLIVESASLNARFAPPELQNKDSAQFLVIR